MDIITGENGRKFRLLLPLSFISKFIYPVRGEGIGVKGRNRYFRPLKVYAFIRVHDNLVLDPSNNKSIIL